MRFNRRFLGTRLTPTLVAVAVQELRFLSTYYPGATIGDVTTFYGHYTLEVLSAGNTYGMLSVNGYTGQVWYHTWHGTFTQELTP